MTTDKPKQLPTPPTQGEVGSQRRPRDRAAHAARLVPASALQVDRGSGDAGHSDGTQAAAIETTRYREQPEGGATAASAARPVRPLRVFSCRSLTPEQERPFGRTGANAVNSIGMTSARLPAALRPRTRFRKGQRLLRRRGLVPG